MEGGRGRIKDDSQLLEQLTEEIRCSFLGEKGTCKVFERKILSLHLDTLNFEVLMGYGRRLDIVVDLSPANIQMKELEFRKVTVSSMYTCLHLSVHLCRYQDAI
jgi:hypothetical protein